MMQAIPYDVMQKHIRELRERICEFWAANDDGRVKMLRNPKTGMHYLYVDGIFRFKDKSEDVVALYFNAELYKRGEI